MSLRRAPRETAESRDVRDSASVGGPLTGTACRGRGSETQDGSILMKLHLEELEYRRNPSTDAFGVDEASLYSGIPVAVAFGDFNGDGGADEALVAGP